MPLALTSFLDLSTTFVGLDVADRDEAIALLGQRLEGRGLVRPTFVQAAIERERTLPTGLPLPDGVNVAVPHTDPEHVLRPGLAVATLARPVPFGSMDDPEQLIPVSVVFVMALSERKAQIEMLQSISEVIQDRKALDGLLAARTPAEVLAALGVVATGVPDARAEAR